MILVEDVRGKNGWVKTYCKAGVQYRTTSYNAWFHVCQRCKVGGYIQRTCPYYVGCYMSTNFMDFQYFTEWHMKQVGYAVEGYHLDKDILVKDNKCYGEDTCVLVPQALNKFLVKSVTFRGEHPQGVFLKKATGKFCAQINIDSKLVYLGYYANAKAAFSVYKAAKEAEDRRWYERLISGEYLVDSRVIERMRTWTLEEV